MRPGDRWQVTPTLTYPATWDVLPDHSATESRQCDGQSELRAGSGARHRRLPRHRWRSKRTTSQPAPSTNIKTITRNAPTWLGASRHRLPRIVMPFKPGWGGRPHPPHEQPAGGRDDGKSCQLCAIDCVEQTLQSRDATPRSPRRKAGCQRQTTQDPMRTSTAAICPRSPWRNRTGDRPTGVVESSWRSTTGVGQVPLSDAVSAEPAEIPPRLGAPRSGPSGGPRRKRGRTTTG